MSMDAKWYAEWVRLLPASTADEKMRNLEAADMLEELDKRVPHWISTKERWPEENQSVLIYVKSNMSDWECVTTDFMWRGEWAEHPDRDAHTITHWMSLPEPPEEDDHAVY